MNGLDYEKISERAREQAKREAERMWPPDMPTKRRDHEEEAYIRLYRQMTTGRYP